ncbi:hypothetical protein [Candidatus Methanoperedens nitratireducens]|uniref:Uncharacterized protein n=1 Tax=Candidatus Methanoperedens nitratireducens TaxID=1392998 RepID=A0A284VUB7_9EURY|nr:hypothetical protein [Candidatus Methanoperedens nitroreducens]SNQ62880.1 hypothetical protein MNV_950001 [Candidatus Methanoperedens nitroreducens]
MSARKQESDTMVEKTKVRPDIRKLKIRDVLHVGTEDKGEVFKVTKLGENTFILDQGGDLREYGRAVMAKNIYTFAEKFKAVYWITHEEE